MSLARQCLWALRAAIGWVVCMGAAQAWAQPTPTSHFQIDVGLGTESQTSPLFQFEPDSTIVYPDGDERLGGSHVSTALHGSIEWLFPDGLLLAVGGSALLKRAPDHPGFDQSLLSVQPSVHFPVGLGSLGAGISVQTLDVAKQHFQKSQGLQLDWTLTNGDQLWGVVLEESVQIHPPEMGDLDAVVSSVAFLSQTANPFDGVDGLDVTLSTGRERNVHGYGDLSNRSAMLSVMLHWSWLGANWTAGHSWRHAVFDEAFSSADVPREDRTRMLDLSAQWPLSPDRAIRVELNQTLNASNTRLYENTYHQFSVTFQQAF